MEKYKRLSNDFVMSKSIIIYIYMISIFLYFILKFIVNDASVHIPLIFRIYYITLSIILFVLLKQVRRFYKRYVSKIIIIFFSLMIFISSFGFIMKIYDANSLIEIKNYINLSRESILLIETFASYVLTEYYLERRKLKIESYGILILIITCTLLSYFSNLTILFVKIIYTVIEIPAFIKIVMNLKKSNYLREHGWSIIKVYISSTVLIFLINIYAFNNSQYIKDALIEVIHFANFTMLWNFIISRLVKDPYKALSRSLNDKNGELDELNHEIELGNAKLESSINLLRSKEYLYSTLFRFMPHPIIILNADNDRILFVNKQFLKISGISKKREIINKKISNYIDFVNNNAENKDYDAILYIGNQKKFIKAEFLPYYENVSWKLLLIKDRTSKVLVDEIRKEVENKQIEESIRREFLSNISHDLKTPINVIYSAMQVEKIYVEKEDFDILKKYNDISKQNCISLIKLTNNLIDNSKINSHYLTPRLENMNIVEVIEDNAMSLVEYVKLNNINLIFDTNTEECYLDIDREFMYRIILNLVSNAVKFTKDGGQICVVVNEFDDKVNISVKDNGIGIDEEFIYEAFNRYSIGGNCNPDRKSGTGIGLFVVKQLIELQGGKIEIKRNNNLGTTVSIEFRKGI